MIIKSQIAISKFQMPDNQLELGILDTILYSNFTSCYSLYQYILAFQNVYILQVLFNLLVYPTRFSLKLALKQRLWQLRRTDSPFPAEQGKLEVP
jgi:hypothetical protein